MSTFSVREQSIEYPESDGQPMGETDWHIDWTIRLRDLLKHRYQGQRVYVGSDMLLYYKAGVPRDFVVPDGFVVLDCDTHQRRTFKMWEEDRVPNVIFEFTSKSTRRSDEVFKPKTYAQIGVREYFIFDPHGEYLKPQLQGYRLNASGNEYDSIEADEARRLHCKELGITLEITAGRELVLKDAASGLALLTRADSETQRAEQETQRAESETQRADAVANEVTEVKQRNAELEIELQRLRDELDRRD